MIDEASLVKAGYRPFRDKSAFLKGDGCEALWQKRVDDDCGTRYFVNVYEWRLDRVVPDYKGRSPSFSSEVQFSRGEEAVVDIRYHGQENQTIENIESFFAKAWADMGFDHHELRYAPVSLSCGSPDEEANAIG